MFKRVFFVLLSIISIVILSIVVTAQDDDLPYEEIIGATTVSNVNLRGDASTSNPAIGTLGQGEQVIILEEIPDGQDVNGNPLWYRVQLPDESEAFIWAGLLSEPEVVSRRCLTTLDYEVDVLWLVNREDQDMRLLQYDSNTGTLIEGGRTGVIPHEWRIVVTEEELQEELGLISNDILTVDNYSDPETCRKVGATVQQSGVTYFVVRQTLGSSDIRFVTSRYTDGIYKLSEEAYRQSIDEWVAANPDAMIMMELEAINPVFRYAVEIIPEGYFKIESQNGTDVGVYTEIIEPTFDVDGDVLELMNSDYSEQVIMIYMQGFGWMIPQFETETAQIFLSHNFTTEPDRVEDGRVLSIRPIMSSEIKSSHPDGYWYDISDLDADSVEWLQWFRGGVDMNWVWLFWIGKTGETREN